MLMMRENKTVNKISLALMRNSNVGMLEMLNQILNKHRIQDHKVDPKNETNQKLKFKFEIFYLKSLTKCWILSDQ